MEQELYHYGILGMKWGIRRYQNKDGSLTEAGRKRYAGAKGQQKLQKDASQIEAKVRKLESKKPTSKNTSEIEFLNKMKSELVRNLNNAVVQKGESSLSAKDAVKEFTAEDEKKIIEATNDFFSDQSNKNKFEFSLDIEDDSDSRVAKNRQLADRFMSGEFNKAIYSKILNETYDSYLDWCDQGNIKPQSRLDFIQGIRKAGFNSGGVSYFPRNGDSIMTVYVNDNDTFWGHVFGVEISARYGVMKRKVDIEG